MFRWFKKEDIYTFNFKISYTTFKGVIVETGMIHANIKASSEQKAKQKLHKLIAHRIKIIIN
jgi:hypothetical protein